MKGGEITSDEKTPMSAAEDLWTQLAEYIKLHTPSFFFSVKDETDGNVTHFKVEENVDGKDVHATITEHTGGKTSNDKVLLQQWKQDGGGTGQPIMRGGRRSKHRGLFNVSSSSSSSDSIGSISSSDSLSDSDSDSDDIKIRKKGKMGYNYVLNPFGMPYKTNDMSLVYYPNIYDVNGITLPSFMTSFTPYVNIKMLPLATVNVPAIVV
jgi:hypothetical protein